MKRTFLHPRDWIWLAHEAYTAFIEWLAINIIAEHVALDRESREEKEAVKQ